MNRTFTHRSPNPRRRKEDGNLPDEMLSETR